MKSQNKIHSKDTAYAGDSAGPLSLEAIDIECVRGFSTLFHELCFTIEAATALHVRGTNGRGKTSLLRILAGLRQSEQGEIKWNGVSIRQNRSQYLEQISYQGHETGLKGDLNAIENLTFASQLRLNPPRTAIHAVLERLDVDHVSMLPCYQLSAGQKQRIALARTMLSNASLWILDEPSTAIDRAGIQELELIISEHVLNGGMVIYSSHHDFDLQGVSSKALSLDDFAP